MVGLVPWLQAAEDGNRIVDRRLSHKDGLEAAFERLVFFHVVPILVERRGADASQLATCQRRFEQIRRIGGTFRGAGTDDRVQFVNEENNTPTGIGHFAQDGLQPILEFATVFCSGNQGPHV